MHEPNRPQVGAALGGYADRLLAGTGLDAATAADVASGRLRAVPTAGASAAAALRDGWASAEQAQRALSGVNGLADVPCVMDPPGGVDRPQRTGPDPRSGAAS